MTTTQITGFVQDFMAEDYRRVESVPEDWRQQDAFMYENDYSIVGVVVYETCEELIKHWTEAQGILVRVMSQHMGRSEPKAAEGYLALLTSGKPSPDQETELTRIRHNTTRLRKLVAAGRNLQGKSEVRAALSPLLRLSNIEAGVQSESALQALPRMLSDEVPQGAVVALRDAYDQQRALMKALHNYRLNR